MGLLFEAPALCTTPRIFAGVLVVAGLCILILALYNLLLHPLRRFPGPKSWAISRIPYARSLTNATLPYDIDELHQKYGPIVRVAPDEIAFAHPQAWKDVMGRGSSDLPKWAQTYLSNTAVKPHIQNCVDMEQHRQLRKAIAPGFSDASLRAQEDIVERYASLLVRRLKGMCLAGGRIGGEKERSEEKVVVDLNAWFNYLTFDIIGDLAFGESFGCLETSDYHPWVQSIFKMGSASAYVVAACLFPPVKTAMGFLLDRFIRKKLEYHLQITAELMKRRIDAGSDMRSDIVAPLLKQVEENKLGFDELVANSAVFIAAGSETTATTLAGCVYYLLRNPEKLEKVKKEIRETFENEEEIGFDSVRGLKYMIACLDETMRLYPPVPTGLPRVVPTGSGGTMVCERWLPEDTVVTIQPYAMYHSPALWTDPEKFVPERFTREDPEYANDAIEALKPFMSGTRDCIGKNLGMFEMRLALARFLFNFDIELVDESVGWIGKQPVFWMVRKKEPFLHRSPESHLEGETWYTSSFWIHHLGVDVFAVFATC
ncbi:cytochrome p450 [Zalerion maritima]|uniref:Cytochrome p450 n=1 Tax=Zalerion maritima TaxID=339359 RepID=A0AAD5RQL3_9PEZI|nr:cytochrome p450 [Zalerion maritima]